MLSSNAGHADPHNAHPPILYEDDDDDDGDDDEDDDEDDDDNDNDAQSKAWRPT